MFFALLIYTISFSGLLYGVFNYSRYLEKTHFREKCRQFGLLLNKYVNNKYFDFFFENFLNQFLMLNESFCGFLEGFMNLQPMIELYPAKEDFVEENIKKMLNPEIPLIEFNQESLQKSEQQVNILETDQKSEQKDNILNTEQKNEQGSEHTYSILEFDQKSEQQSSILEFDPKSEHKDNISDLSSEEKEKENDKKPKSLYEKIEKILRVDNIKVMSFNDRKEDIELSENSIFIKKTDNPKRKNRIIIKKKQNKK
ncbi:hypothetical protein Catovirus_1_916 [Catovirus CTV1]|uniref:Uncharacterized protein n=1 Tax=Catovirus CTV1 TaxID=1977631 RepID=A0A1V0SAY9_9VIRU|nr:hypothetical protein Catovirus_1_916 [Catovirus CTV1]